MKISLTRWVVPSLLSVVAFACSSSSASPVAAGQGGAAGSGVGAGGSGAGGAVAGATSLSGTLGALGPVKPTVSSLVISNSGETLIYLSSAPITCDLLKTSKWLLMVAAGAQVVEIVIQGDPMVTSAPQDAEVNYAPGGKSSSYEVNATSGTVAFTKAMVHGVVEGTVAGAYADGSMVTGTFHADFCDGGQGY